MGADKPDVNPFYCKLDYDYKSVVITFDIKHIVLIADIISAVKTFLYICKVFPVSFFYGFNPFLQCRLCIWMQSYILFKWFFCNNSHIP